MKRWVRIQKPVTRFLGYQYAPARDLIEIDLTYLCNLRCNNCNRSSAQAPEARHMSISQIRQFVDDSIAQKRHWRRIRILGGEPTLHPEFLQIMEILIRLKEVAPKTIIEVVTNGFGAKVNAILDRIPEGVQVENSAKSQNIQPGFGPFNLAPIDSWQYAFADYRNGCDIAQSCGIGLTPQGYYPCAVAGGIDRVLGLERGRQSIPHTGDDMRDLMAEACRLCGRFRDGHYVPEKLRKPLMEQKTSKSWAKIYHSWREGPET
ncbi:radical SAM protein [Marinobacter metalliresistant]|uniref:Radical SAM protein n=1 Tax=Marinobacter metalliresistant TaxID=2961995 RepID=A0ABZ2VXY0_9GAMM